MSMQPHFEALYSASSDPYGTRARWYEQRKRDIVTASLPRPRFRSCYEPGCGSGALTVALAARCDALLAADFSTHALLAARQQTANLGHVRLEQHTLPEDWPVEKCFDLVVLSEVGYFLSLQSVRQLADHCAASLSEDGVLVACDWQPPFAERACSTDAWHGALAAVGLPQTVLHTEGDFCLRIWARDPRSVAQREGIR